MEIRHYKFDRISLDPNKCFGKPSIRGLRMPIASILSYLSSGMTVDEILKEWPELEREDIYQALGGCPRTAIFSKIEECLKKLPQPYS